MSVSTPSPLSAPGETLRQYTERRTREIAAEYGVTQVEVRDLYDWYDAWWRAVQVAAEAGQMLPKRTMKRLTLLHQYHVAHNWPKAVPAGYVLPSRVGSGR